MTKVETLIISDRLDFATDYVTTILEVARAGYLRINRDALSEYRIILDLSKECLIIGIDEDEYEISDSSLKSVYYRAPTFLRETFLSNNSIDVQLESSQWMAFVRNLCYFENARWMNNPINIFRCENKMLQLRIAKRNGFLIPETYVSNRHLSYFSNEYIIKSIDTVVLKDDKGEAFFYTNIIDNDEISKYSINTAPIFFQEYLKNKLDIRITVIGKKIFPFGIYSKDGSIIEDDWRKHKDDVVFKKIELPNDISNAVIKIMTEFDLNFAGIDLIKLNNKYYFLEINPTGEWAWLMNYCEDKLDYEIANWLG